MRRVLRLLLASVALPCLVIGQTAPETGNSAKSESSNSDPEVVLLLGMPVTQGQAATLDYLAKISVKADLIADPVLRRSVRLTLAAIEENPQQAAAIRQKHLASLSSYFVEIGSKALTDGDLPTAVQAGQLAVRCQATNPQAKLFYADLLHRKIGKTDDAITLLSSGLDTIDSSDKIGRAYLERYGQLLQARHRDPEVVDFALKYLTKKNLTSETKSMLALQAATSLYWCGRYPEAVNLIDTHKLDRSASGTMLLALCLFDGGKVQQALSLLDNRAPDFRGQERDAILSQHGRLLLLMRQPRQALSLVNDRVSLDGSNGFLRVQRLAIMDKLGQRDEYDKELRAILDQYAGNDAVMLTLSNYGAQRGYNSLCELLANLAVAKGYDTATFSALHLESLIAAGKPDTCIRTYQSVNMADKAHFRSNQAMVQALLGIAHHLRPKANAAAEKADRSVGDKYLDAFLESDPGPEAYRSVARHLVVGGAPEPAARLLAAGVAQHPWHSQLRADWISARILAGQGEGRGTRTALVDEVERLLAGRRPLPPVWGDILGWLRTESGLDAARVRKLEAAIEPLVRPDLDREAFLGR